MTVFGVACLMCKEGHEDGKNRAGWPSMSDSKANGQINKV